MGLISEHKLFLNVSSIDRFDDYDVFVAGTGPAGSVLATRLADLGRKVLLFETGSRSFDHVVQAAFTDMTGDGHYGAGWWPKHWIRALGGTSNAWAGYIAPLDARDFENWPIKRAELQSHYEAAAKLLGRSPSTVRYEAEGLGGFRFKPFSMSTPTRFGPANEQRFSNDAGIDVVLETTVSELVPSENRQELRSFKVTKADGTVVEIRLTSGQSFVAACGGIGNAQLLIAQVPGSDVGAGNENDMAGRCLMEHPHFYGAGRVVLARGGLIPSPPADFGEMEAAFVPSDDVYQNNGGRAVTIAFRPTDLNPGDGTERYVMGLFGSQAAAYDLVVRSEMKPDPENRVVALSDKDPAGLPKIHAVCVAGSDDLRAVTKTLRYLGQGLAERAQGRLRINNSEIYQKMLGGGHIMGTTRMGVDPRTSVVDKDCRVHNYRNFYVVGSSVFPSGGASNPTLTIMALALRLANKLAEAA